MTITDKLNELYEAAKEAGLEQELIRFDDDEDVILFALNYLISNLDHAFEPDEEIPEPWTQADEESAALGGWGLFVTESGMEIRGIENPGYLEDHGDAKAFVFQLAADGNKTAKLAMEITKLQDSPRMRWQVLTPMYWDCECREGQYIQPRWLPECQWCKAVQEDQPNSHAIEAFHHGYFAVAKEAQ